MTLRHLAKRTLGAMGYDITARRENPILELWDTDPAFNALYAEIQPRTAVQKQRLFILYQLARDLQTNIAEVGVFRGGTSMLFSRRSPKSTIYSFDTFGTGMPDTNPDKDTMSGGEFAVDGEEVRAYLHTRPNIVTIPGIFPHTADPIRDKTFGLVYLDVDIYQSYKDCLAFFYPRMNTGGVIIADDYGFKTCPGAKEAWDEFFADNPECSVYLPTGQAFVVKR